MVDIPVWLNVTVAHLVLVSCACQYLISQYIPLKEAGTCFTCVQAAQRWKSETTQCNMYKQNCKLVHPPHALLQDCARQIIRDQQVVVRTLHG